MSADAAVDQTKARNARASNTNGGCFRVLRQAVLLAANRPAE
jgi:hypothetical protein